MLSSLAGSAFLQTLSSSIARFSHLALAAAKDLLGLLAPVVLEFLRREQIAKGLDSKGIASLLASQRGNIRRAMPGEMAQHLQGGDGPAAGEPRGAEASRRPEAPAARRRQARTQALWLLSAILLAGVAVYLLPMRDDERDAARDTGQNITVVAKTSQVRHAMP